ncbi:shikimate dehydrogenase [Candidatus Pelagibacter sp.]|nr:shikimate dehydrogenase [Candidatus Pelagibacter sp.]
MKKYLVIGNPINHSLSPKLHNFWFKQNQINATYDKTKLDFNQLKDLILEVKEKRIDGINITVPFKNMVIPYLDQLSIEAEKTKSVNTIYLKDKKVIGHNTDIDGFEKAINKINFKMNDKKIFILGAGGVVPSIVYALNKMGAINISISNRTKDKAQKVKDVFKNLNIVDWGEMPEFDVIINATSLGLNKNDKIKLDFSSVGNNKLFYDVIYNPSETNFLKIGKNLGNKCENGKLMFIYQAFSAFKLWHDVEPKINDETIKLLDQ